MEFRKTVTITLYARQQKRHRCTEQILDSVGEGKGGMFWENSIETSVLSRVKQITSPGWMHETSAQGWCTGKTQRDGMGKEAGGGSGWGTHVNPWLIHVNVWQKPLQYCKVISLQLIKTNEKKIVLLNLEEQKSWPKLLTGVLTAEVREFSLYSVTEYSVTLLS